VNKRWSRWWAVAALFACAAAHAHEVLPASLLLAQETSDHEVFAVRWRVPATQGAAPEIAPVLPPQCARIDPRSGQVVAGSEVTRWRVRCLAGLPAGTRIAVDGLGSTVLDVLVRVAYADGRSVDLIARPRASTVTLPEPGRANLAASAYFALGVEHILTGVDHLLFVLCLILLVRSRMALLRTISAFTLAHSVTLAAAALGVLHVPQAPVEATIALSILFLACELASSDVRGSLASRRPALVAFAFGLLHGLGFAGALAEVGLPPGDVPLALLLFNLGVESGQVLFVAGVLALLFASRRIPVLWFQAGTAHTWARRTAIDVVGALSAFWWLQRMAPVLGL
jgi:hydrogenase/urease accessory protein HupE